MGFFGFDKKIAGKADLYDELYKMEADERFPGDLMLAIEDTDELYRMQPDEHVPGDSAEIMEETEELYKMQPDETSPAE